MNILICGVGYIAEELLKRLGESWRVTLLDKDATSLRDVSARFVSVIRVLGGDASSPVVLQKAGLEDQDVVLALTRDGLLYESLVPFVLGAGGIPLDDVAGVAWEDTRTSRHRRARKYRRARLLEIVTRSGDTRLFVLAQADAPDWEQDLRGLARQ